MTGGAEVGGFAARLGEGRVVCLDGGLSTALEEGGNDLSGGLWSARLLVDSPEEVVAAHRAFVDAGAEVCITASYQVSVEGFAARGYDRAVAERCVTDSVTLARRAISESVSPGSRRRVFVAGSVGPYGAMLADGSEYTGDYGDGRRGVDHPDLVRFHAWRARALVDAGADVLAVETVPCVAEARALAEVFAALPASAQAWVSFTCLGGARLRSGEGIAEGVAAVAGVPQVVAVGVNCTSPEDVTAALQVARTRTDLPFVVYPNLGRRWDGAGRTWTGPTAGPWQELVAEWVALGARAVGGCCGVGPDLVAALCREVTRPRPGL